MKKKITKFLLILCLILFVIYLLVSKYSYESTDMSLIVGTKIGGGELTMSDYYTLVKYMDMYKESILHEKYELAYSFIGSSYKKLVTYEEFVTNIPKNIDKMRVAQIDRVTNSTFKVLIDMSGETYNYSLILEEDSDNFDILPDGFLDYQKVNQKEKRKGLQCVLTDYTVNYDNCVFNFELKNTAKDSIKISSSTLYTNLDDVIKNDNQVEINPGETKMVTLTYQTDYTFPKKIVLSRDINNGEKTLEYTFDLTK